MRRLAAGSSTLGLTVMLLIVPALAHAGEPSSRVETFATIGYTKPHLPHEALQTELWPTLGIGAGWRLNPSWSLGASTAWSRAGTGNVAYPLSGDLFTSARTSVSLVPVCAYVTLRLPKTRETRPYVSARAGAYTVLAHSARPDAPDLTRTRPGFGASFGVSADEARFAPRLELAYDARSTAPGEFFAAGWMHMLTFSAGMRFQP